jgi:hypothetical protein
MNSPRIAGKRALQQMLPAGWRFAYQSALDLISQMEHLAWRDRADRLDAYFSQQADGMLGPKHMSTMIGIHSSVAANQEDAAESSEKAADFATWCRAVTTAVLIDLDQDIEIRQPTQALTYLIARDWQFAKSAANWVSEHGMGSIADVLQDLPGYAMVLLATSPNDTVERFFARDAFWQGVKRNT